ncbi:hypothetical protein [Candidatus Rariloculus sp.]|uniref:hypothetical protein n=1 Tax=Candidatus Rariloculus sp. TaxID=3101265 RepID=UPI003D14E383
MATNIDRVVFMRAFDKFRRDVQTYGGQPFGSLRDGVVERDEGYKTKVRELALVNLDAENWPTGDMGQGYILDRVIRSIEIHESKDVRNNMTDWGQNRYGASEPEFLRKHLKSRSELKRFEEQIFSLFHDTGTHGAMLDDLVDLLGKRYSLLAYLFFLRDETRYLPIRPTTFDKAFETLGLDLRTSGRCSWENYRAFNATIEEVRHALTEWAGLSGVRLIDAHSFLWMMVRVPDYLEEMERQGVRHHGELEKRALKMAYEIQYRTQRSNGQTETRTVKAKEFGFKTASDLSEYIMELWGKQNGLCVLTKLPMLLDAPIGGSSALVVSVDRIDSDGHYAPGNLQLTCQFANLWKSDSTDEDFHALIDIVRRGQDALLDHPRFCGQNIRIAN